MIQNGYASYYMSLKEIGVMRGVRMDGIQEQ
jgi:hypothetical protein